MVSISKLINNGLLLIGQTAFQDLASPEQSKVEQYNIVNFLGGAAPFIQRSGAGISVDIPPQCTLEQVQLLSRHGERYPAISDGASYEAIYKKIKNYNQTFKGDLSFFNNYVYFVPDQALYEKETTPYNSQGLYSGTTDALRHGAAFRAKYGSLYSVNSTLPIFTSTSGRCYKTGEYFARGFLGEEYSPATTKYVVISENGTQGANSLTPRTGCPNWNWGSANDPLIAKYNTSYLNAISDRFEKANPGLNITAADVEQLFPWCAYEINVRGSSPVCDLFSNEEFIRNSYHTDLTYFYGNGPGYNLSAAVGATLLNASLTLLKDDSAQNKIWLSFTHDVDIEIVHAALGIVTNAKTLPVDYIPSPNPYVHSQIVPQGARVYTEKYKCGNESYVRYIVNDAVTPIQTCSSGPGFSCKFSDFEKYVESKIGNLSYVDECQLPKNVSQDVSFYWDYNTVTYNAPLING